MYPQQPLDKNYFSKILIIDIETVPAEENFKLLDSALQGHWRHKHSLITRHIDQPEDVSDLYDERAGIYAEFGKIVCISMGRLNPVDAGYAELKIKSYYGTDEKALLQAFFEDIYLFENKLSGIKLAGHNIKEFDVPYICRRSVIHNINLPVLFNLQGLKPWEVPLIDTMDLWKFGDYKHYVPLDLLAALFGIESSKQDMDGSRVAYEYWKNRNLESIKTYCEKDISTTAKVMARLLSWPLKILTV